MKKPWSAYADQGFAILTGQRYGLDVAAGAAEAALVSFGVER
jgi:hypothetical protein